jgi:3-oxoacyl-[acyl-carrier protein] reductase
MDFGISGKTALVLGASSGLGQAMAIALAKEGVNVAVGARRQDLLADTVTQIEAAGAKGLALPWDLADRSIIPARLATIEKTFGPIDILINNTGGPPLTPAAGQAPELWLQQFEVMVLSLIAISDAVLPGMRERKWGRIITSTSSGVATPIPGLGLSNSLRGVLHGWSKTVSREVAKDGVTVNVLVPGRIATDRISQIEANRAEVLGKTVAQVAADALALIPMGRLGHVSEYGAAAAFLASQQAGYITGTVTRVDGGASQSVY